MEDSLSSRSDFPDPDSPGNVQPEEKMADAFVGERAGERNEKSRASESVDLTGVKRRLEELRKKIENVESAVESLRRDLAKIDEEWSSAEFSEPEPSTDTKED